jgi:hypothetical protein
MKFLVRPLTVTPVSVVRANSVGQLLGTLGLGLGLVDVGTIRRMRGQTGG